LQFKFLVLVFTIGLVLVILLGVGLSTPAPTNAQAQATSTSKPTRTSTRKARPSATPTLNGSGQISAPPTQTPMAADEDANTEYFADFLVVRYDPKLKILYIEPVDPSVKIVIGNQVNVAAAVPVTPTPTPTAFPLDPAALRGKIIFKSTRDGGSYPNEYLYYAMNPDGTGIERLDTTQTRALLTVIQGLEGFSPDRTKVAMGDRACGSYYENTCQLYILDASDNANMIFSDNEPSEGLWFGQPNVRAKEPVWSPRGTFIAFASNHEVPAGCRKTSNIFVGTPKQNAVIRRLTAYCAGADTGRPSFNPDGSELVYWTQFPGPNRDLYIVDVGEDTSFDWRSTTPKRITFEGDNWDPLWVK